MTKSESVSPGQKCAVCNRDNVVLYRYEFGQKRAFSDAGFYMLNPYHAEVLLCSTDYTLAGNTRRRLKQEGQDIYPQDILHAMIEYRKLHPIRSLTQNRDM